MNPGIKQFWINRGKKILVIEKPETGVGAITNVPFFYFIDHDFGKHYPQAPLHIRHYGMQPIACPCGTELAYWFDGLWHREEYFLKIIKMRAFL